MVKIQCPEFQRNCFMGMERAFLDRLSLRELGTWVRSMRYNADGFYVESLELRHSEISSPDLFLLPLLVSKMHAK